MKYCILFAGAFLMSASSPAQSWLSGAWSVSNGQRQMVYIIQDDYLSFSSFDIENKKFEITWGGAIKSDDKKFSLQIEFNSSEPKEVGKTEQYSYEFDNGKLVLQNSGERQTLTRIDDGTGPLAGNWRISARMQGDKMNPIVPGPRKTLKILSGTRFQWIAINTDTKEFFGTGGGTYTFKDGKYTEIIEFFSRDKSRVGASLTFDGKLSNGVWTHSGLNSRGEPLMEEWRRDN